ncbi:DUF1344 domain-containing protein [Aminobacter aganoensis]|uniref:DUF1344 domain-containing protein n=2 Tax=Aminobacter TaxID=31988 RepID=A0A7X0KKX6_9HYPH|nr:DUF1344 domain-containing protein [Aminobacter aganoensis]KQU75400.1 hypothetical protein ASC75_18850 [Aminobacter sp. DSM 101952]MBB6354451.1 hypothetical protein [Aminobacter aganoensis]
MKKIIIAASAFSIMTGAAFASSANGVVGNINSDTRVITLESGKSFTIPRDVALPAIQAGDTVSIQLNDEGDKVQAVLR